jgi:hypothetical protein
LDEENSKHALAKKIGGAAHTLVREECNEHDLIAAHCF